MTYNILNGHLNVNESNFLQERGWLPEGTLLDCLSNLLLEMLGKIIFTPCCEQLELTTLQYC